MGAVAKLGLIVNAYLLLVAVAFVDGQPRRSDVSAVNQFETRCGWFSNPTPANISLYDRDGEWIIGVQGGYQVEGDWPWPAFKARQWVVTNVGSYGYGCVCMRLRVDRQTHEVLEIKSAWERPLAACRRDQSLKKHRKMFEISENRH